MTLKEVISKLEHLLPPTLQEDWDNTGWQVAPDFKAECTGVLTCLDLTEDVIYEAKELGVNLIVSHHPLFYKPVKQLCNLTSQQRLAARLIKEGIALYSAHTSLDNAPEGISYELAKRLGLKDIKPLLPKAHPTVSGAGLGCIGRLSEPVSLMLLIEKVKEVYNSPMVRVSRVEVYHSIQRVALCSGAGDDFVRDAIAQGAQAYITSDLRYHDFLDFSHDIMLIDTSHYESEIVASELLYNLLSVAAPGLPRHQAKRHINSMLFL